MKQIALFFFLHLSLSQTCRIDYRSQQNVWEERLYKKIFCNYNNFQPPKPLNGSDFIVVNTQFVVKSFKFLSEIQEFSMVTWASISWMDERLKWDPNDFDGIDETVKYSYKLWLPGIKLSNSISDINDLIRSKKYIPTMLCKIRSNGRTMCISSETFEAKCATDLSDWPFDTQVCSLEFSPLPVIGAKVRLDVSSAAVSFIGSEYGGEWDIMDHSQVENQDAEIQIKFYFTMMRHAEGLAAILIFPLILLSLFTLSTLYLDVRHGSRVFMACFSLMCHFYFLSELSMNIPEHTKSPPRILFYYRGSVIMTIIGIILTFLMKILCQKKEPIPKIIAILNENVYTTYAKWLILPRWNAATDDDGKRELSKEWIDFASILNTILIYVFLFVYIIMCCVFMPLPSGLMQNIRKMSYEFK